ncbi:MAG TPA: RIP metalloprotease RseP [Vicinamibacterales bacterium]|nr:RIP metalloprotease RseP [Vicinamibacterales bacterium]
MITLLAFVFVLGVLVFVHELGHFLAAKRVGIRVLKFQLGFNPTIVSFRRGDTEYGIGALPLGGYVKMAGENPEEARSGRPDEFLSKSKWERFQVLIMGPVMNLLLAVVLLSVVLYHGSDIPAFEREPPVVGVVPSNSAAAKAGIRPGDLIVSVADRRVETWDRFYYEVGTRPNKEITLGVQRDGAEFTRQITTTAASGKNKIEYGDIGVLPNVHPHVRSVTPGEPAEKAGLQTNDIVLAVNGEPITFASQLKDAIAGHPDQLIAMSVLRSGSPLTIHATPARRGGEGLLGIGIGDEVKTVKLNAVKAVETSVKQNVEGAGLILQTVWGLFTRETSPRQLMGPVAIAQLSKESVQFGLYPFLGLMASISLNLGLINLFPIPVLDGGHIFIMALEGVARRDLSVRVKEKMLFAGLLVLVMLMVTVFYNDLTRTSLFEKIVPWK